jgi:hypothetical protein
MVIAWGTSEVLHSLLGAIYSIKAAHNTGLRKEDSILGN